MPITPPNIPTLSSKVDTEVKRAFIALKTWIEQIGGSGGVVTQSDLSAGLSSIVVPSVVVDTTIPPALTGFTATGAFRTIMITWTDPVYARLAYVEIWRATVDDIGSAVMIGTTQSAMYTDLPANSSLAVIYYYWGRIVSDSGILGPFNAVAGTAGSTADDPAYVLELLTGEITATELHTTLTTRIDLIDVPVTGLVDLVAAQQADLTSLAAQIGTVIVAPYDVNTAYAVDDYVRYASNVYKCILATTVPSPVPTNTTYWSYYGVYAGDAASQAAAAAAAAAASATESAASATSASTSATDAAGSATASETSRVAAVSAQDTAISNAGAAATSASTATTKANEASASAASSAGSATTATTKASAASTSATQASNSATTAAGSASSAGTSATNAANSATAAGNSAGSAATSASVATTKATDAGNSATSASGSATTATTQAGNAATSAGAASTSAGTASTYAGQASTSATNAAGSATSASNSATAAATSASNAAGSASAASTSASTASTKAGEAGTSATAASSSATSASSSAGSALIYKNNAATSATNAANSASAAAIDYSALTARLNNAGGTGVTVETISQANASDVTGLKGQYSVKIDANGKISGFGLNSTSVASIFEIVADRFAVVMTGTPMPWSSYTAYTPGRRVTYLGYNYKCVVANTNHAPPNATYWSAYTAASLVPFVVDADWGAVLDSALIKDATITNAKIADLAVDSAKIADATITTAKIGDGQITTAKIGTLIQSTTYTPGSVGWIIKKDGTAEFNGGTFRGAVTFTSPSSGYAQLTDKPNLAPYDVAAAWVKPGYTTIDGFKIYTGDAYVDTLQIKGNAVTIPVSAYLATPITITSSYATVQQVTIDAEGAPISLNWTAFIWGTAIAHEESIDIKILRDDTEIYSISLPEWVNVGYGGAWSVVLKDTPATGSHTYYLQIKSALLGYSTIKNMGVLALGVLR